MKFLKIFTLFVFIISCSSKKNILEQKEIGFKIDTLTYFDQSRNRKIPIAIYQPENLKRLNNIPIIFSHGWGENKGGDYLKYSYLTEFLASKGYFVVSIQHELASDEMLAMNGNLKVTRKPNWERGVENIYFILNKLKNSFPKLDYNKLTLIGHSNGGDMTVLFAHEYTNEVNKIISMDNRRMDLPRTLRPKIYTLRSNDYPADEGVLPNNEEKEKFDIAVDYTSINHSNMDNDADEKEREYLTRKILEFLKK